MLTPSPDAPWWRRFIGGQSARPGVFSYTARALVLGLATTLGSDLARGGGWEGGSEGGSQVVVIP